MILLPYSSALRLSRPSIVTHLTILVCLLVFYLQRDPSVTQALMYFPDTWNPIKMITSALAHADLMHLMGNMIFYLAFAPALELLLGNWIRYIWIMLFISFVVGISYSISVTIGVMLPWPALGFSGVVMGMIGLSAYLMPHARIKVFFWYWFGWKILFIPAWILAVCYIGLDAWSMLTQSGSGGVNLVAHVAGGVAGYLYGYLRLKDRRDEVKDELNHEIEAMKIGQKHGKSREQSFRYNKMMNERLAQKKQQQDFDKFMGKLYQMVKTHRDSEAIITLLTQYGLDSPVHELEELFDRIKDWGPSRTLLCLGRLIIDMLDREMRFGKAIVYIDKCQAVSPLFVLHDIKRTLVYAEKSVESGQAQVARSLLVDSQQRYGRMLNHDQCNHWLQKACKQSVDYQLK